ncbi:OmpL47-type beta-barrel domain-containing protein [Microscilla marina]|uniref:Ig-like domain-containing protein n=1 Tax=Microscilla marina ATCC 23134 TaxID=313606 RepID=A1ZXL2_MICM2|nr:hypothetical protein [Microscilla marina]EAY24887.1 hypothetical protein M23134_05862 [Microscilla marina ATCC 23134]
MIFRSTNKVTLFLSRVCALLLVSSMAMAQTSQRAILQEHIRQLRALADSLEKKLDKMSDKPITVRNTGERDRIHQKKIFVDKEGRVFWQVGLPVYVFASSKPDGSDMHRLSYSKVKQMEAFSDPMYWEGPGKHFIGHKDANPNEEVQFEINADGADPFSVIELKNAPRYEQEGEVFFGKGLVADIITKDELAGVRQTYQSIDSATYVPHTATINFDEDKDYTVNYYGVDKVGNVEKPKFTKFRVDLNPPVTEHKVNGDRKGDILSPKATILLTAQDQASGISVTRYRFNEQPFQAYKGIISLNNLKEGEYVLTYHSIDRVKNQEEEKTYSFYLDKTAPKIVAEVIGDQYQNRGRVFISSRTKMRLTASDNKSGVDKVYYAIDGGLERLYREPFPLVKSEGTHTIKYTALDRVKNKGGFETSDSYENMFLDLTLPSIKHTFTGPVYRKNDTVFISRKTLINIVAKDPESGIKRTGFKIDGARANPYREPFSINDDGYHKIAYYALDNVNNRVAEEFFVIVDNKGPEMAVSFSAPPIGKITAEDITQTTSVYATGTYLFVTARDANIEVESAYISINGSQEVKYNKPILMNSKGLKTIKIRGVDKLGNETVNKTVEVFVK